MVLDEPMNNLAAAESPGICRLVREVRETRDTRAFISHSLRLAFQVVVDRMVARRRDELLAEALSPKVSGIPGAGDVISSEALQA